MKPFSRHHFERYRGELYKEMTSLVWSSVVKEPKSSNEQPGNMAHTLRNSERAISLFLNFSSSIDTCTCHVFCMQNVSLALFMCSLVLLTKLEDYLRTNTIYIFLEFHTTDQSIFHTIPLSFYSLTYCIPAWPASMDSI